LTSVTNIRHAGSKAPLLQFIPWTDGERERDKVAVSVGFLLAIENSDRRSRRLPRLNKPPGVVWAQTHSFPAGGDPQTA